jgi:hypothetical protein
MPKYVKKANRPKPETYNIDIPESYSWLFDKARFKICYGGRGAGRSWNFVRYMLIKAMQSKIKILCCREIQNSILESVHSTISSQIEMCGLSKYFTINDRSIVYTLTGSEFIFSGLYRNVNKIKSMNQINICDVEEAETVSEESWKVLLPTIREADSEILVRFNTGYEDDDTWQRFVANQPLNSIVVETSYKDNPYFNDTLNQQREADLAYRPLDYPNIWEGKLRGYGRKVWQDWDDKVHIKEFKWEDIKDTANCYMATDPAQHYYPAMLWMAIFPASPNSKELIKWIYAEYPSRSDVGDDFHVIRKRLLYTGSLANLSRAVLTHDGTLTYGNKILKRGIDTRFAKGSGSGSYFSGDTQGLVSEWAKKENGGLIFNMPQTNIIDAQKEVIRNDLQYNHVIPISPFNQPKLYISSSCKNLIMSMNNHRLEEDKEQESEKYKDFSDTLRILYATIHNEKYKSPTPRQEQQYRDHEYAGASYAQGWMA